MSHHTIAPYTLSFQDFKLYLSCPKKVAFRVMGVKSRTFERRAPVLPTYKIGRTGEQLTAEILQLIEQVQDKIERQKTETTPSEPALVIPDEVVSQLSDEAIMDHPGIEEVLTPQEPDSEPSIGAQEVVRIKRTIKDKIGENVRLLAAHVPRILSVSRPRYRNRDVFASGFPDFQIDTVEGHRIIEVKNIRRATPSPVNAAILQTRLYLAMLEDGLVSDAIISLSSALGLLRNYPDRVPHLLGADKLDNRTLHELSASSNLTLPSPPQGLVFLPRQAEVELVDRGLDGFRDMAVEIWKIKRAAFAEGVLPHVEKSLKLCKRCAFQHECEEGVSLETVPPAPLVYAAGKVEVGPGKREYKIDQHLSGLWEKIEESGQPSWLFREELQQLYTLRREEFRSQKIQARQRIYREFPEAFDQWGGKAVVHDQRLRSTTSMYYRLDIQALDRLSALVENEIQVLNKVRKRWRL